MKVYLSSMYSRKNEMKKYAKQLRESGIDVTSTWLEEPHGPNSQMGDVPEKELSTYAVKDYTDVWISDLMVFFAEENPTQRGGRHVEFGLAVAWGIQIIVVGPKENIFHLLKRIEHVDTWECAFERAVQVSQSPTNYFR